MIEAIIYLLAITAAEWVTVFVQPVGGIVCHALILVATIMHSAVVGRHFYGKLILALALAPLVRILSLCMPLSNIPQMWWYPIIYAPLLAAAILAMRILNYRAQEIGINFGAIPIQLAVALAGIVFGIAEHFILAPQPLIAEFTWQEAWLPAMILLLSTGFVEEFVFRGVLQHCAVEVFRAWGIIYVSFLFAILHMGFRSWIELVFVFAVSLFFGWVVKKTGSLFGVTLAHGTTNIVLYLVAPFFF